MTLLAVVLLLAGGNPLPWLPLVAVMMLLLFAFSLGVSFLLTIANVYFRDTQHLVGILFQVWFYLTPIVYPIGEVERRSEDVGALVGSITILDVYRLNPMEGFAEAFRLLMYDNRLPGWGLVLQCVCWAAGALVLGGWVFKRHEARLAEVL
jgi:ABC-2 type transport system permease protein